MELFAIISVIIIAGILYFGGKFANFKSQLMNELGKRGMSFHSADILYTAMADQIHKMHHDGISASNIADMISQNYHENDQHQNRKEQYESFEAWFDEFKIECDATKTGITPFLEFMDISGLQKAYEMGENPRVTAVQFAKGFDPSNGQF